MLSKMQDDMSKMQKGIGGQVRLVSRIRSAVESRMLMAA